jgi:hypothetical protein
MHAGRDIEVSEVHDASMFRVEECTVSVHVDVIRKLWYNTPTGALVLGLGLMGI